MTKSGFIKWLLELKEEVARELVEEEELLFTKNESYLTYTLLVNQNNMLADIINVAQDIKSLD